MLRLVLSPHLELKTPNTQSAYRGSRRSMIWSTLKEGPLLACTLRRRFLLLPPPGRALELPEPLRFERLSSLARVWAWSASPPQTSLPCAAYCAWLSFLSAVLRALVLLIASHV